MAPAACAAMANRWLGYEGPFAEVKKWSARTNRSAQRQ